MNPIYAPRGDHLPVAPELATLSVLDAALQATFDILHLQHDLEDLRDNDVQLAADLITLAECGRTLIRRYAAAAIGEDLDL